MDQLKLLSQSMKTSTFIRKEYTSTRPERFLEDTPSRLSDGERRMELITDSSPIPGEPNGEKTDSSRFVVASMNVELKITSSPEKPTWILCEIVM
ncbi:Protein CBG24860 [Caenorhabditis briggsae]|uniref:Protein CBG24860 n=1 Tax=Caenorhabditis briggsae TaxID=6238 RepID=A8WLM6_CAEBR|nr:Protein CBG24860 [Caenorhabditis briggsae]CAP21372.2 Protein CBG24860 [Caenorhabditis briggsae]